jgi:hypothetical protein
MNSPSESFYNNLIPRPLPSTSTISIQKESDRQKKPSPSPQLYQTYGFQVRTPQHPYQVRRHPQPTRPPIHNHIPQHITPQQRQLQNASAKMCYHRRLHFILCNHVYNLEVVRPCALALETSGSPSPARSLHQLSDSPSSTSMSPAASSASVITSTAQCTPTAHPCTTYKVRRECAACAARWERLDERLRVVREGLGEVRGRMEEMGLLGSEDQREGG